MKYLGVLCFVLATGLATGVASATDQGLLNLVMPDAKVVLGIEVDQARVSPFGQYMLSRVQTEDANLQKLINDTGFDPRKNLSEVVVATNGPHQGADSGLVLARGSFDVARIGTAAQAHGATVSSFSGVPIIAHSNENRNHAIAFPDSSTAIMGNLATVQDAITRMKTGAGLSQQSLAMVQTASAGNDLWFVTLAPLSQFAGSLPDEGVGNAMKGSNLFQKVQQASGGVKFGDTVKVSGAAVTTSEKDAQSLLDAVRFLISLATMNRQNDPAAGMVAALLDALQLQTSANTMTVSLSVPESQLESVMKAVQQQHHMPSTAGGAVKN